MDAMHMRMLDSIDMVFLECRLHGVMSSVTSTSVRRGKLSLKRKRDAEYCGEEDSSTNRFSYGQPSDGNSAALLQETTAGRSSDSTQPELSSAQLVCSPATSNIGSNELRSNQGHQTHLPDLPAWYGVKKKEEKLQASRTEVLKVGDVKIEWHLLPMYMYCHLCLTRRKQKRAVKSQECSSTSAEPHTKHDIHVCTQNVGNASEYSQSANIGNEYCHRSLLQLKGAFSEDSVSNSSLKDANFENKPDFTVNSAAQNSPKLKHDASVGIKPSDHHGESLNAHINGNSKMSPKNTSTPAGALPCSPVRKTVSMATTRTKRTDRKELSLKHSGHHEPSQLRNKKQSSVPRSVQKETDSDKHVQTLKIERAPQTSSHIRTFPKDGLHCSSLSEVYQVPVTAIDSEQQVQCDAQNKTDMQHGTSEMKLADSSMLQLKKDVREQCLPRNSKLSCKHQPVPNSQHLKDKSMNPSYSLKSQSPTLSKTRSVPLPATNYHQETQDSALSSDVIVLDGGEEETLPTSLSYKRKLSKTLRDTHTTFSKKLKTVKSVEETSASPAARLLFEPKCPISKHSVRDYKPGFGGQKKTSQTRLENMGVQTTPSQTMKQPSIPLSDCQAASQRKSSTANQGNHIYSRQAMSSTGKKTSLNMFSNVQPLFKKQTTEQLEAQYEADSSKNHPLSNQTRNQQMLPKGTYPKGINTCRESHQSALHKGVTATLKESAQQGKMTSVTLPAASANSSRNQLSKQPHNQSTPTFKPNIAVSPLEKPPSLSTGFHTARDIQANRDTYMYMYPKQGTKSKVVRDSTKHDSRARRETTCSSPKKVTNNIP
ncbi:uncharacterized protein LOC110990454 [Acanthaster planci]|uniref:Uncharacterized protein LOC110990454 n=1 Tax=Acanthaster planci TaxID=133434 RepID=A0A8B8A2F6_ACAPL|nr:uncharacterized protein LOC110990454 [Acanthaster planci]